MPWLGTFHAICVKLLRRHAELVGLKSNFTILDTDDQVRLLKQLIVAAEIDEKRWPARHARRHHRRVEEPRLDARRGARRRRRAPSTGRARRSMPNTRRACRTLNAVDFGDLLLHVVEIFQKNDDVLAQYQRWFRYILVDEYQDTNVAQYLWLRLLAQGTQQHLLRRRRRPVDLWLARGRGGQHPAVRKGFSGRLRGAAGAELPLHGPYPRRRLRRDLGNKGRLGKTLWTEGEEGEKVRLIGHWDGEEEARWVGEEIEAMGRGTRGMAPISPDRMAILVRASHQMRAFEDRFLTIGLPYRVIGGPRFYERMEIRDAMAYFRVVVSPMTTSPSSGS
jgi:DNA helicase-2/ATP-dependent DNA helicase PcrA